MEHYYKDVIKRDRRDPDALEQDEDYVVMSLEEILDKESLASEEWQEEKKNERNKKMV